MNITSIAKLPSRGSPPKAICSGRNSPRAPGQRATTSRRSARGYVKRDIIPDDTPSGAQGWFFNTRREKLLFDWIPGNLHELSKTYFATTFLSSSPLSPARQSGLRLGTAGETMEADYLSCLGWICCCC